MGACEAAIFVIAIFNIVKAAATKKFSTISITFSGIVVGAFVVRAALALL